MIETQPRLVDLRNPCVCGGTKGIYRISGMQRPVFCVDCGIYANFNASRIETNEPTSTVRSIGDIPSSQRQRILERDLFRCVMCGRYPDPDRYPDLTLHIDHLITRADCIKYGLAKPSEVNDDANLVTACDECNLGHGSRSVSPQALLALSVRIAQRKRNQK